MSWSGLPQKIEDKIIPEPNSGCWLWLGALRDSKEGYGGLEWEGRSWRAHRLVYTLLCASVPANLDIDHLCRNRICCNPQHLEPCTRKKNIHRGQGIARFNREKTHCSKGHPFDEQNTYWWANQRFCRACGDRYKKLYNAKKQRDRAAHQQVMLGLWDSSEWLYA